MRFLGMILAVAGFAIAFIYPSYQVAHTGEEVAKFRVFDRETGHWKTGWKSHKVRLTSDMAPLRIRISGKGLAGANWTGSFLNFNVEIKGADGIVFSDRLDINIEDSNLIGESRDSKRAIPENLFRVSQDFGIVDNGTYTVSVKPVEEFDTSIAYMDVYVVANVEEPATQFQPLGYAALGLGVVLFVLGRSRKRRKKSKNRVAKKQASNHKTKNKPEQKWGRQAKDD